MNKLKLLVENSKIYNWSNIESNLTGIKSFGLGFTRFIKPNFPIRDDKQLGLIVGHILGDGWIDSRFSQPCYCNSNKDLLDEFASCMNNLFGVQPRIWVQKIKRFDEKSEWSMRIENVNNKPNGSTATLFYPKSVGIILFNIFGKFVNKRKKKIPEISFELSTEFKSGIIRAMYDDEGSVSVDAQHIRLHQDNSKMLGDIRKMLFDFKISSSPVRNYYKKGKKRYYFGIYGYNNFVKFQKLISFTSFNKKEKLNELIRHLER
jgi:hypothetical protein